MATIKENEKFTCCHCEKKYDSSMFFKAKDGIYAKHGQLPVCKNCVDEIFETFREKYNNSRKAMWRVCMLFDLYYDDAIFESCNNGKPFSIGNYIKRLNMFQCQGKSFENTFENGVYFNAKDNRRFGKIEVEEEKPAPEEVVSEKDIAKWGGGLEPIDYKVLNEHYNYLKNANPDCDSNQEIFINDLCYTKMQQMKSIREGNVDNYNKLTESYRKSFQQAGLKIVKEVNTEDFLIGVTAETIEKYTPAEYYKDKKLYKDFDKVGDYFKRFIYRPLKNLQFGTKDRDKEFYVHDEEEVGVDDE